MLPHVCKTPTRLRRPHCQLEIVQRLIYNMNMSEFERRLESIAKRRVCSVIGPDILSKRRI